MKLLVGGRDSARRLMFLFRVASMTATAKRRNKIGKSHRRCNWAANVRLICMLRRENESLLLGLVRSSSSFSESEKSHWNSWKGKWKLFNHRISCPRHVVGEILCISWTPSWTKSGVMGSANTQTQKRKYFPSFTEPLCVGVDSREEIRRTFSCRTLPLSADCSLWYRRKAEVKIPQPRVFPLTSVAFWFWLELVSFDFHYPWWIWFIRWEIKRRKALNLCR